jgi:acyl dehydratase
MADPLHAEDLPLGELISLGRHTVTEDEIIAFASQWDPLPFHLDPTAAEETIFGGLIASGIHTLGILQRLTVTGAYCHWDMIAGRSLRNIELPRPVRPGMTLDGALTIDSVGEARRGRCLVKHRSELRHEGEVVLSVDVEAYFGSRHRPS